MTALGLEERLHDPTLVTAADRMRNGGPVMREIAALLAGLPTAEVIDLLRGHGVPCMPVLPLEEVAEQVEAAVPGTIQRTSHPMLGLIQQPRPPVNFDGQVGPTRPAPGLGEHTDAVLAEAGLHPEEVDKLRAEGVVA